jgi:uncharacterized protein YxjI
VNQKAKLIGVNTEYAVYDQHGRPIGAVREVGQSRMKNAVSVRPAANRTRRLQVVDLQGRVILVLTRPAMVTRSTLIVRRADGTEVGQIVQKNLLAKARFSLESSGRNLGWIKADHRSEWDFGIQDTEGVEVARVTKTWAGWTKERYTKSDNYVVEIHRPLDDPLRSLVVAAALAVDTALKETNAGGSRHRIR